MKNLNHPSILKFIGYSPVDFENKKCPTIITELAVNGSLQNIIDNARNSNINSTRRLIIIYGIVAGMAYLHEHSIVHNDLKPSNVLLDEKLPILDSLIKLEILNFTQKMILKEQLVLWYLKFGQNRCITKKQTCTHSVFYYMN